MVSTLSIYTTCPPSRGATTPAYRRMVAEVGRWSERAGCVGTLVYADNGLVDPWLVSQILIDSTERLVPLVAVQPVYLHPYAVAKMIASIAFLHGRRVDLNLVAGGFRNDLEALGDPTPHDCRYTRLREYTDIVVALLRGEAPVSRAGQFYRVTRLALLPPLPETFFPALLVSGSSDAGRAAARALGAVAVEYPRPGAAHELSGGGTGGRGIRVGILTREDDDEAWRVAHDRFPADRRGRIAHELAAKVSDSSWHGQLSALPADRVAAPYWMEPFLNYQTFCPYLVGSHARVGEELRRYLDAGIETFILDVPREEDDLGHTALAFTHAMATAVR